MRVNKYFIVEPLESINELNSTSIKWYENRFIVRCRVPEYIGYCNYRYYHYCIIVTEQWNNFPCHSHRYTPLFHDVADNALRHLENICKSWMRIGKYFDWKTFLFSSCEMYNNLHFVLLFVHGTFICIKKKFFCKMPHHRTEHDVDAIKKFQG